MIKIKRNTGIMGVMGHLKVYINGEKLDNIKANNQVKLELLGIRLQLKTLN